MAKKKNTPDLFNDPVEIKSQDFASMFESSMANPANTLKVGDKATFRSSSDLTEYTGRIVKMHGLASPNTNLAIKPAVLRNEPFRVTVQAEEISHAEKCTVGQTGVVRFYPSDAPGVYAGLLYWLQYWVPMP